MNLIAFPVEMNFDKCKGEMNLDKYKEPRQNIEEKELAAESKEVSSGFFRRKIVEKGIVEDFCSDFSLFEPLARLWINSSLKLCRPLGCPASAVVFERDSALNLIGDSVFCQNRLKSIVIPASVVSLGKSSFDGSRSHRLLLFLANGVSLAAPHLSLCFLKVVVDLNGLKNQHLLGVN
jgi:hypothetical protein